MSSFGIYNLTLESKTFEFSRNGGTIGFPDGAPSTLASNTTSTGFCIAPFEPIFTNGSGNTVTLSSIPMGLNGKVRIIAGGTTRVVQYKDLNTASKKLAWLTSNIPELTTTFTLGQPTFTVTDKTSLVHVTFIDEDINYVDNKFTGNNNVLTYINHHVLQLGFNLNV